METETDKSIIVLPTKGICILGTGQRVLKQCDQDLAKLERIKRDVPLMVVSQVDLCWLISSLFFYIRRYKDIKQELENGRRGT